MMTEIESALQENLIDVSSLGAFLDDEGNDIPDDLKIQLFEYLQFRKDVEYQQTQLAAKGDQLTARMREKDEYKNLWSEVFQQTMNLRESVDYDIDHERLDPILKTKDLYDACLKKKINTKKLKIAMIVEHFPKELQEIVLEDEFDNDKLTALFQERKLKYEDVLGMIKSKYKYTAARLEQSTEAVQKRLEKKSD